MGAKTAYFRRLLEPSGRGERGPLGPKSDSKRVFKAFSGRLWDDLNSIFAIVGSFFANFGRSVLFLELQVPCIKLYIWRLRWGKSNDAPAENPVTWESVSTLLGKWGRTLHKFE